MQGGVTLERVLEELSQKEVRQRLDMWWKANVLSSDEMKQHQKVKNL